MVSLPTDSTNQPLPITLNGTELTRTCGDINSSSFDLVLKILNSSQENNSTQPLLSRSFTTSDGYEELALGGSEEEVKGQESETAKKEKVELQNRINQNLKAIKSQLELIFSNIKTLEERNEEWEDNINMFGKLIFGEILQTLEYYDVNVDNIRNFLKYCLDEDKLLKAETRIDQIDSSYKWINAAAPLIFNLIKYSVCSRMQNKVEKLNTQLKLIDSSGTSLAGEIKSIQKAIDTLRAKLEEDQKNAMESGRSKFDKFLSKVAAFPISLFGSLNQQQSNKICKYTLHIFKRVTELFSVKRAFNNQKKLKNRLNTNINIDTGFSIPLSPTEEQQKLEEELAKQSLPTTINHVQAQHQFNAILKERLELRNKKIKSSLPFICALIEHCCRMSFDDIDKHFSKFHISIKFEENPPKHASFVPPTSLEDWHHCIQNEEFLLALTEQWVEFHETASELLSQAITQATASKIKVESTFLYLCAFEYFISIVSSIFQLALCLPKAVLKTSTQFLELFVIDLSKMGIYSGLLHIFHPLYPDMSFRIDSMLMTLIKHLFAVQFKYRPNQYSIKGYKLITQLRWLTLAMKAYYLISLLEQSLLWINVRVIENLVLRKERKPLIEDERTIKLNKAYEERRIACKKYKKELERELFELTLNDAKLMIHPFMEHAGKEDDLFDPIKNIVKPLKNADFALFSPKVIDLFNDVLKFDLAHANKYTLRKRLEEFFTANDVKFFNAE